MRIAAFYCVYNQERFIGPALEQLQLYVDHQLVHLGTRPWNGDPEPLDRTRQLIAQFFPQVEVVEENWLDETVQRNRGLKTLKDYDYIWVCDADEYYTTADILSILQQAEGKAAAYVMLQKIYWKSPDYRQDPTDTWTPTILLDPRRAFFAQYRAINLGLEDCVRLAGVMLHHFSYVRTDAEVASKLAHFSHPEEIQPEWHEVWRTWQPGDEQNILPYKGTPRRAGYDPAPAEVTERFFRWQDRLVER